MRALDAVLDDIARQGVDQIYCGGDVPNPFFSSLEVWQKLRSLQIPIIRGNHEDYIVSYYSGNRPEIQTSVQFLPIQIVARHLGSVIAHEFAALPFDHLIAGPHGDDLYLCHASPLHNARSYIVGVDTKMAASFARVTARTIVAGHIHTQWAGKWQDKNLIICGSVGLPHHGKNEAQYALFAHMQGEWRWDLRTVPYDFEGAMHEYLESGALKQGGPIAWMLYDELWCAKPRLAYFLPTIYKSPTLPPTTLAEWSVAAQKYLKDIDRWSAIQKRCPTTF